MSSTVQRKLWEGKLPVCFTLPEHEVSTTATSTEPLKPLYLLVPRVSYLPLLKRKILEHFSVYIDVDKCEDLWFEYNGVPLKWNYPTGVLYDMQSHSSCDLPWCVTVHFQSFPKDKLLACTTEEQIKWHFFSTLKEADYLKHKGEIMANMSQDNHSKLWYGLKTDNFEQFWSLNKTFMEGHQGTGFFHSVPVRVYYGERVLQKRITISPEQTSVLTLREVLKLVNENLFDDPKLTSLRLILHGVSLPLHTEIQWLSENLSYPDNFVHICISDL